MSGIDSQNEIDPAEDHENTMRILIATDIHLGYKENDPVIGNFLELFN